MFSKMTATHIGEQMLLLLYASIEHRLSKYSQVFRSPEYVAMANAFCPVNSIRFENG